MFDTLCALPLTSELFSLALHPSRPLLAVGLATGHVQTFQLPSDSSSPSSTASTSSSSSSSSSPPAAPPTAAKNSTGGPLKRASASSVENGTLQFRRSSLSSTTSSSGNSLISTAWRTRRHKGSCRAVCYSHSGAHLFSVGTDGLLKCADSTTGRVVAKLLIPSLDSSSKSNAGSKVDEPCLLHALNPTALILGTDSGALHLYELRMPPSKTAAGTGSDAPAGPQQQQQIFASTKPVRTWRPFNDDGAAFATCLTPLPPSASSTSGVARQFLAAGGTSLALVDMHKPVPVGVSSGGAKEAVNCCAVVDGLILTGNGTGGVHVWDRAAAKDWAAGPGVGRRKVDVKRYVMSPEGERLEVGLDEEAEGGDSIDAMCAVPRSVLGSADANNGMGGTGATTGKGGGDMAVLGWESGRVEVLEFIGKGGGRRAEVVAVFQADEAEGVVALGFDVGNRLVVGAGDVVNIYGYKGEEAIDSGDDVIYIGDDDDDDDDKSEEEDEDGKEEEEVVAGGKRPRESDDDEEKEDEQDESSSEEEQKEKPKRKKRKKKQQQQQKKKGKARNHQTFSFAGID